MCILLLQGNCISRFVAAAMSGLEKAGIVLGVGQVQATDKAMLIELAVHVVRSA